MPAADAGREKGDNNMIKELCILVLLGLNSWKDIRKKEIFPAMTVAFGCAGLAAAFCQGKITWEYFISIGIGAGIWGIGLLSKEGVGMGDGLLLAALGTVLRWEELLGILLTGVLCCGIWGLVLLTIFHKDRNTEIPFVPFILLGYLGGLLL